MPLFYFDSNSNTSGNNDHPSNDDFFNDDFSPSTKNPDSSQMEKLIGDIDPTKLRLGDENPTQELAKMFCGNTYPLPPSHKIGGGGGYTFII